MLLIVIILTNVTEKINIAILAGASYKQMEKETKQKHREPNKGDEANE